MTKPPVIYVVDDDDRIVSALCATLESVGYAHRGYTTAHAFLDGVKECHSGCVLLDVIMPGMDGLQIQAELQQRQCTLPLIFLSGQSDVNVAVAAMRCGAFDYIEKPPTAYTVIGAVNRALEHFGRLNQQRDRLAGVRERFSGLTRRERDVLGHLAAGETNKTIADQFGLSSRTVEIHRANIMGKMGAQSLADLVRMCVDIGIA